MTLFQRCRTVDAERGVTGNFEQSLRDGQTNTSIYPPLIVIIRKVSRPLAAQHLKHCTAIDTTGAPSAIRELHEPVRLPMLMAAKVAEKRYICK